MARNNTVEAKFLEKVNKTIDTLIAGEKDGAIARLSLLEAVVCRSIRLNSDEYYAVTHYAHECHCDENSVEKLRLEIVSSGIPFSLALAALARIDGDDVANKRSGSVYTDFRLARYIAEDVASVYRGGPIVDPACGTATILAACAEYLLNSEYERRAFAVHNLFGVDLSPYAVRGAVLALASYVETSDELSLLVSHFVCNDSLELGGTLPNVFGLKYFALVVGNPPWERVRPSRSEFALESGMDVTYGGEIGTLPEGYEHERKTMRERAQRLSKKYGLKGGMDLYRAFLSLSMLICRNGGTVALYLPAGIIRSKSLASARNIVLESFSDVGFSVFTNSARFFRIDSRFKFVLAHLEGKGLKGERHHIDFRYCSADDCGVKVVSKHLMNERLFNDESGELGAPEVRTDIESRVLTTIWKHGARMGEHPLFRDISPARELDMTLDKHLFRKADDVSPTDNLLPLIEGRMVAQYRCGCKRYRSGSGRSAKWDLSFLGDGRIVPQFYVDASDLGATMLNRSSAIRVGFCDIAGQTNERAMQAAVIAKGCICGNKVPTLIFDNKDAAMLWLGIVNSFTYDWVLRRYITTTINFFILENLPLPKMTYEDVLAKEIIENVKCILELQSINAEWGRAELWRYAVARAKIDAQVFRAYGLALSDLDTVIADFPLVDKVNSGICDGLRPTIELFYAYVTSDDDAIAHVANALKMGALPYVPNEHMRGILKLRRGGATRL